MVMDKLTSSPGAICTNPLSPAVEVSIAGKYIGCAEINTSISVEISASGSVTFIVRVPELLGNASTDSLTAIVVCTDCVGMIVTLESVGITSHTESNPDTSIE
ncbi:MAG: hypothetical protein DWC02_04330 [Candidatus Poseidoniales archaeon]|nr:MAG: hypothetical protein DWC02_04330 [Candidatus Poseidoniales archaeon]